MFDMFCVLFDSKNVLHFGCISKDFGKDFGRVCKKVQRFVHDLFTVEGLRRKTSLKNGLLISLQLSGGSLCLHFFSYVLFFCWWHHLALFSETSLFDRPNGSLFQPFSTFSEVMFLYVTYVDLGVTFGTQRAPK